MPVGRTTRVERIIMAGMLRMKMLLVCLLLAQTPAAPVGPPTPLTPLIYEAYAVRFGVLPGFPVSGLIAGADRARTLDIPVMVWLLKGSNGKTVLIDSGFYRQKFLDQWKPRDF